MGSGNRSTLKAREDVVRTLLLQGGKDSIITKLDNLITDSCQYLGNSDVDTVDRYRFRLELYGGIAETGYSNDDFEEKPFKDPCGAQRLANGHTVIASYGASDGIRLFEVDKNKKIVWTYNGYGAHEFQLLTTNDKKLKGSPLK
jgi:hypothetical protein